MLKDADGLELYKKIKEILKEIQANPRLKILTTSGEDLQSVETIFFRNGETEYVCLWKDVFTADEQSNHTVKIIFPYKANIYDVRTKRYYGFTDEIKTEIAPLKPRVFALVPYKIDGIVLTLEKNECKPGAVISYNVRVESSAKEPSPHVIRLEVINPVGKQINYYGTNLLAENGKGCYGYIRTSLNEEKGSWKITAKEIVSGKTAKGTFSIN